MGLTLEAIRDIADSTIIFQQGEDLYRYGAFQCIELDPRQGEYVFEVDGSYGDYTTGVQINGSVAISCDGPIPPFFSRYRRTPARRSEFVSDCVKWPLVRKSRQPKKSVSVSGHIEAVFWLSIFR